MITRTGVNVMTCDGCNSTEEFPLYDPMPSTWKPVRVQLADKRSKWLDFCPNCKGNAQQLAKKLTEGCKS